MWCYPKDHGRWEKGENARLGGEGFHTGAPGTQWREHVSMKGRDQLPPHLSPFYTQEGRESCLGEGSKIIPGGPCPAVPRAVSINCPFMEPFKESAVWGTWLLKLVEGKGEGVGWGGGTFVGRHLAQL